MLLVAPASPRASAVMTLRSGRDAWNSAGVPRWCLACTTAQKVDILTSKDTFSAEEVFCLRARKPQARHCDRRDDRRRQSGRAQAPAAQLFHVHPAKPLDQPGHQESLGRRQWRRTLASAPTMPCPAWRWEPGRRALPLTSRQRASSLHDNASAGQGARSASVRTRPSDAAGGRNCSTWASVGAISTVSAYCPLYAGLNHLRPLRINGTLVS